LKRPRLDLVRLATRLVAILGEDRCLLVGGLAVGAHGYVRATDDIDLIVDCSLAEARRRLASRGIHAEQKRGDPLEGGFPRLKGTLDGVPFDVLPPLVPLDWSKATELSTKTGRLLVVDLEGLLRLKLRAQGVQDVLDVAMLTLIHPTTVETAREIADAYRVRERLDSFLSEPRTITTARELRRLEQAARRAPTRVSKKPRFGGARRPG
jgi:hypothetical protein